MKRSIISSAILLCMGLNVAAGDIYVSARNGNDLNDGSASSPVMTVAQGFKIAREWRRLNSPQVKGGIRIVLDEGIYRQSKPVFIRPEDSGTADAPTVVTSAGTAQAVISGGVDVTGWKRGTSDLRLPADVRDKVWVAEAPRVSGRIVETRQLYVNGSKAVRATQWEPDSMRRMVDFDPVECTITIPVPEVDLSSADRLEMTVHQRWAIAILRVKLMEPTADGNVKVRFYDPESQLEFAHPWPQPVIDGERGNSSYMLGNAAELLDSPGEWFQDYPSGRIYYYPAEGVDMSAATVTVPYLETIMEVDGSRERPVHDIVFDNVAFEYAAWLRPSLEGHVTLQGGFRLIDAYKLHEPGLPEKAELENQAWIARPEAAITVRHASAIDFRNCRFSHLGATGLDYVTAVSGSSVTGCSFTDIGGTAIQIGTFPDMGFETHVPYIPAVKDDICSNITISGNTISDATNEDWGCVGIGAGYVRDLVIADNEVSDLNYSGICVGWGWTPLESGMRNNRITGNHVHHFAKQLYDAGGIYTLSYQPGSVIARNRIEDLVAAPYATNYRGFYIYFDEATDGFTVEDNFCPDAEFGYNRPGPDMTIRNNGPQVKLPAKQ